MTVFVLRKSNSKQTPKDAIRLWSIAMVEKALQKKRDLLNNERNRSACKGLKTLSPSCKHIENATKQTNGQNGKKRKKRRLTANGKGEENATQLKISWHKKNLLSQRAYKHEVEVCIEHPTLVCSVCVRACILTFVPRKRFICSDKVIEIMFRVYSIYLI